MQTKKTNLISYLRVFSVGLEQILDRERHHTNVLTREREINHMIQSSDTLHHTVHTLQQYPVHYVTVSKSYYSQLYCILRKLEVEKATLWKLFICGLSG